MTREDDQVPWVRCKYLLLVVWLAGCAVIIGSNNTINDSDATDTSLIHSEKRGTDEDTTRSNKDK